jgi:hypothetical protein
VKDLESLLQSCGRLRAAMRAGTYGRAELFADLAGLPDSAADALVHGLFGGEPPAGEPHERIVGRVPHHATPAASLRELLEEVRLGAADVFYDLGSGLGVVAHAVASLTLARVKAVEVERAYHASAVTAAAALGLTTIEHVCADAAEVDCADGTVFFLFNPFFGPALVAVVAKLRRVAERRPITVVLVNAQPVWGAQSWLRCHERHREIVVLESTIVPS